MHAYSKKLTLGICSRRQLDSQSNFCNNCYFNNSLDPFSVRPLSSDKIRDQIVDCQRQIANLRAIEFVTGHIDTRWDSQSPMPLQ